MTKETTREVKKYVYEKLYGPGVSRPKYLVGIDENSLQLLNYCVKINSENRIFDVDVYGRQIENLDDHGLITNYQHRGSTMFDTVAEIDLTFKGWWVWWNAKQDATETRILTWQRSKYGI